MQIGYRNRQCKWCSSSLYNHETFFRHDYPKSLLWKQSYWSSFPQSKPKHHLFEWKASSKIVRSTLRTPLPSGYSVRKLTDVSDKPKRLAASYVIWRNVVAKYPLGLADSCTDSSALSTRSKGKELEAEREEPPASSKPYPLVKAQDFLKNHRTYRLLLE